MAAKKARQAKRNDLLRRARKERGWSQQTVADEIDTEVQNISRWETGVVKPKTDTIQALCKLFKKSPQELGFLDERLTLQPYHPSAPVYDYAIPLHFEDPGDFIGRDKLLIKIQQLLRHDRHVTLSTLHGLPGVGKTALAIAIAHDTDVRKHFTGGVFWAGLGKQPNIVGVLSRWGKQLGMNDLAMEKLSTPEAWAGAIRAAIAERHMLIIIDDAWKIEHVLACQLGGSSCAYLITTRLSDVAIYFAREQALLVEELDENDAFLLLERLAPMAVETDREGVEKLVHAVGGLPLAITLIGGYLLRAAHHKQHRRIQAALERLQEAKERLMIEEPQGGLHVHTSLPLEIPLSLHTIIGISYEDLSPHAQQCLQALSIFPAKPNSFSEEAALAVSATSADIVDQLVDYGLVEVTGDTRYTLHQTISDYAGINRLDTQVEERMVEYFVSFGEKYTVNYEVLEQEVSNMQTALQVASTKEMRQLFIKGVNAFCHFLNARGLYTQAESYLKQAQTLAISLDDKGGLVEILVHLGKVASNRGNYEQANVYLQEGLDLARQLRDAERLTSLLQSLGAVAIHKGDYEQANAYLREGLDLARQLRDFKRLSALLQNLGVVAGCRGDYQQTEVYLQEGLKLARQVEHREQIITLLLNLGSLAGNRGDDAQAEIYYQEGLDLARQLGHREYIAALLSNLGAVASNHGDYQQAEIYYQEGMDLARQLVHRERLAFLLQNLGEVISTRGGHERAKAYLEEGLDLARQLEHREHITALLRILGTVASDLGDDAQAEMYYQEGMDLARQLGHREHIAALQESLGTVAMHRGDDAQANAYYQEGLDLARQLGLRLLIAAILNSRGELHLKRAVLEAASKDFHEALEVAPQESQDVRAGALFGLAQSEAALGNYKEARRQGERSQEIFEKIGHKKAPEVTKWLSTLPFSP